MRRRALYDATPYEQLFAYPLPTQTSRSSPLLGDNRGTPTASPGQSHISAFRHSLIGLLYKLTNSSPHFVRFADERNTVSFIDSKLN